MFFRIIFNNIFVAIQIVATVILIKTIEKITTKIVTNRECIFPLNDSPITTTKAKTVLLNTVFFKYRFVKYRSVEYRSVEYHSIKHRLSEQRSYNNRVYNKGKAKVLIIYSDNDDIIYVTFRTLRKERKLYCYTKERESYQGYSLD